MIKLYFVTGNKNKFMEVKTLVGDRFPQIQLQMAPWEKVEIQSDSLDVIVRYAVNYLMKEGRCNFFVEDAGLFIKALKGFPGPYSSYVYKTIGVNGILKLMKDVDDREAYFQATVGLCWNNEVHVFNGVVEGYISRESRGLKGFGFDPIFIPKGVSKTFAEMDTDEKNKYSHRARAIINMLSFLFDRFTHNI